MLDPDFFYGPKVKSEQEIFKEWVEKWRHRPLDELLAWHDGCYADHERASKRYQRYMADYRLSLDHGDKIMADEEYDAMDDYMSALQLCIKVLEALHPDKYAEIYEQHGDDE